MAWFYATLLLLGVALLTTVAVRVLVGGVARARSHRPPDRAAHGSARRILDERYAAGELDTAEYEHRRRALEG
ncbi:SHOCT domain-containing protein [Isoptericola haloaureus]|uniref:SHOCT domain-containing protein n=1 Tax=Isoptericola haloaureus TaxID=1542902 RepID=A0ABU7Z2S1_9MICO